MAVTREEVPGRWVARMDVCIADAVSRHLRGKRSLARDPIIVGLVCIAAFVIIASLGPAGLGDNSIDLTLIFMAILVAGAVLASIEISGARFTGPLERIRRKMHSRPNPSTSHMVHGQRVVIVGKCSPRKKAEWIARIEREGPDTAKWPDPCPSLTKLYRNHGEYFVCRLGLE